MGRRSVLSGGAAHPSQALPRLRARTGPSPGDEIEKARRRRRRTLDVRLLRYCVDQISLARAQLWSCDDPGGRSQPYGGDRPRVASEGRGPRTDPCERASYVHESSWALLCCDSCTHTHTCLLCSWTTPARLQEHARLARLGIRLAAAVATPRPNPTSRPPPPRERTTQRLYTHNRADRPPGRRSTSSTVSLTTSVDPPIALGCTVPGPPSSSSVLPVRGASQTTRRRPRPSAADPGAPTQCAQHLVHAHKCPRDAPSELLAVADGGLLARPRPQRNLLWSTSR
ncbi:hypothetical protein DMC30DRAFT_144048 [Rhodotorula diobovata]|uniref:Uncharacterized protein n=1 Tax=Rhodotorula diobovata TaxID=5288 RepID=A0A5C5G017_9BASI|nr:hypothetical protein DMC30DRAFT_144048 [Rhodotorula diobovata]